MGMPVVNRLLTILSCTLLLLCWNVGSALAYPHTIYLGGTIEFQGWSFDTGNNLPVDGSPFSATLSLPSPDTVGTRPSGHEDASWLVDNEVLLDVQFSGGYSLVMGYSFFSQEGDDFVRGENKFYDTQQYEGPDGSIPLSSSDSGVMVYGANPNNQLLTIDEIFGAPSSFGIYLYLTDDWFYDPEIYFATVQLNVDSFESVPVPEPATILLLTIGLAAMTGRRLLRKKRGR
jgi:hypothetical protein